MTQPPMSLMNQNETVSIIISKLWSSTVKYPETQGIFNFTISERPSFTHWSAWSGCSVSCGVLQEDGTYKGGVQTRQRVPIVQKFSSNGLHEPKYQTNDAETETRECHNFECHTTHWGQWEEWGKCSKVCACEKPKSSSLKFFSFLPLPTQF